MLILILTDVQCSQKAVFSFEKSLNRQNHSSSGSHHLVKKISPRKISDSPRGGEGGGLPHPPLTAIWKTLHGYHFLEENRAEIYFVNYYQSKKHKQRYKMKKLLYKAIVQIKTPRKALGSSVCFLTVQRRWNGSF